MSTLQKHFEHEHLSIWHSECHHLGVPQGGSMVWTSSSIVEPFTQDGAMARLQKFIVSNNEVCLFSTVFHLLYTPTHTVNQHNQKFLLPWTPCVLQPWPCYRRSDSWTDMYDGGYHESMEGGAVPAFQGDKCEVHVPNTFFILWMITKYYIGLVRTRVTYNRFMVRSRPFLVPCCHSTLHHVCAWWVKHPTDPEVWPTCISAHSWIPYWWKSCSHSLQDNQRCWHGMEGISVLCYLFIDWPCNIEY